MAAEKQDYRGLFDVDEEEDAQGFEDVNSGKELVVYLIDCSKEMFLRVERNGLESQSTENNDVSIHSVLSCVVEDLKARIISRLYDKVAVVFFNTRLKKNILEREQVYVLSELEVPSAQLIQSLTSFTKSKELLLEAIGGGPGVTADSQENPIYNALWVCQVALKGSHGSNALKRILLFTNNDNPIRGSDSLTGADMKRTTLQRAKDAHDLGIEIDLYPMCSQGHAFDINAFYKEMVVFDDTESEEGFTAAAITKFEDLKTQMKKKGYRKRVVRKVLLSLGDPSTAISLKTYALLRTARVAKDVYVDARDNTPVQTQSAYICQDTGSVLFGGAMKRALSYGSSKVVFTGEEIKQVKRAGVADLQLLGFRSMAFLKDYYNLSPPTFLYPDDKSIKGSVCAFIALHTAMLARKRLAIASLGTSSMPKMVALVPQEEEEESGVQVQPPGFQMIVLPFWEDIRAVETYHPWSQASNAANEDQVKAALNLIRRVNLKDFSVLDIQNPSIQTHYAMLQAMALEEETLPTVEDDTLPDYNSMNKQSVVSAVDEFKISVYGSADMPVEATEVKKAGKRKAVTEADTEKSVAHDWNEMARQGTLQMLKRDELQSFLRVRCLPVSGNKQELINRILKALGTAEVDE